MTDFISIAKVSRPHGFKGAFVATSPLGKDSALSYLKRVFVGSNAESAVPFEIETSDWMPRGWKLKLKTLDSEEGVKKLQTQSLFARREDLETPQNDEYFVSDLIQLPAIEEESGKILGKFSHLSEVTLKGKETLQHTWHFEKEDGTEFSVPAVKRYIKSVSLNEREIRLQNLADF